MIGTLSFPASGKNHTVQFLMFSAMKAQLEMLVQSGQMVKGVELGDTTYYSGKVDGCDGSVTTYKDGGIVIRKHTEKGYAYTVGYCPNANRATVSFIETILLELPMKYRVYSG